MERTLVLVKPDGVERRLSGEIIARFERRGEIDVDVDDAVAFVEDADGLDVVGTAGAVGGLERAAELDVGVIVHGCQHTPINQTLGRAMPRCTAGRSPTSVSQRCRAGLVSICVPSAPLRRSSAARTHG